MKFIALHFPLAALLTCAVALPSQGSSSINRETARLFGIAENTRSDGSKTFRIHGMQNGSLGVCGKPKTRFQKDILSVEIPRNLFNKGLKTGPYFDVRVKAPASVKKVVFGKERIEIWPSDTAKKPLPVEEEEAERIATVDFLKTTPTADIKNYSVTTTRLSPALTAVSFDEWSNGKPNARCKYKIDVQTKLIIRKDEYLFAPNMNRERNSFN